jgi:hypothetical protein
MSLFNQTDKTNWNSSITEASGRVKGDEESQTLLYSTNWPSEKKKESSSFFLALIFLIGEGVAEHATTATAAAPIAAKRSKRRVVVMNELTSHII